MSWQDVQQEPGEGHRGAGEATRGQASQWPVPGQGLPQLQGSGDSGTHECGKGEALGRARFSYKSYSL